MTAPRWILSLTTLGVLAFAVERAWAQTESSPSDAAASAAAELQPTPRAAAPGPCGCDAAPSCCSALRIHYRSCCRPSCCEPQPVAPRVLMVTDPCTCCEVPVTVCLPACCDDCPSVFSRRGLLVRGVVHYRWCCGVHVRIVFRHCGDVVVDYL